MRYEVNVATRTLRVDLDAAGRTLVDGAAVAADIEETARGRQWLVRLDDGGFQLLGGNVGNNFTPMVEQISLTVLLEDGPKDPAVAVKIRELRVASGAIELRHALQKVRVGP